MLNFCSLYSGSSGNCLFVETKSTKILIDCGTSLKKITEGLQSINKKIEEIDAILVTHEHSDHVQSLGNVSGKFDIPIFTNIETLSAMPKQIEKISSKNQKLFEIGEEFTIGDLAIKPFLMMRLTLVDLTFTITNQKSRLQQIWDIWITNCLAT